MTSTCQRCGVMIINNQCQTCGMQSTIKRHVSYSNIARIAKHAVLNVLTANDDSKGDAWMTRLDDEDIDHMIAHLEAYREGDRSEDHIAHCMTRGALIKARWAELEP